MIARLRGNPPEIRVVSGQNVSTEINNQHRILNFCATALNIFSKEIISSNAKCRKQILKFI